MRNPAPAPSSPLPATAVCAVHPTARAVGVCVRCGAFRCASCDGGGGVCTPCRQRGGIVSGEYAPCPRCRAVSATPVKWTLWGGALGPKMFTHVKCGACGMKYNGKTGLSNNGKIAAYLIVSNVIGLALLAVYFLYIA